MISTLRDDKHSKEFHLYERLEGLNQFHHISHVFDLTTFFRTEETRQGRFEHWFSLSLMDRHWINVSSCNPTSFNVTSRKRTIVHYSDFERNWSSPTRAIKSPCGASAIHSVSGYNLVYDGCSWWWDLRYYQFYNVSSGVQSSVLSRYYWSKLVRTRWDDPCDQSSQVRARTTFGWSSMSHVWITCAIVTYGWTRADSRSGTSKFLSRREVVRLSLMSCTSPILMSDCKD